MDTVKSFEDVASNPDEIKGPVGHQQKCQAHVDSIMHILTPCFDTSLYLALILCVVIFSHSSMYSQMNQRQV